MKTMELVIKCTERRGAKLLSLLPGLFLLGGLIPGLLHGLLWDGLPLDGLLSGLLLLLCDSGPLLWDGLLWD